MKVTRQLHDPGQRLRLDTITRELLTSGPLQSYVDEFSLTGLTANPTILDHGIRNGDAFDVAIRQGPLDGTSGDALFFGEQICRSG